MESQHISFCKFKIWFLKWHFDLEIVLFFIILIEIFFIETRDEMSLFSPGKMFWVNLKGILCLFNIIHILDTQGIQILNCS